jgi:hypothetical protein
VKIVIVTVRKASVLANAKMTHGIVRKKKRSKSSETNMKEPFARKALLI